MSGELLALLGSLVASAFALVRYAMTLNRSLMDRFVGFLEGNVERQEQINERFQSALESIGENVRENSAILGRIAERIGLSR